MRISFATIDLLDELGDKSAKDLLRLIHSLNKDRCLGTPSLQLKSMAIEAIFNTSDNFSFTIEFS